MLQRLKFLAIFTVGLLYAAEPALASPEAAATAPHIAVLLPLKSKTLGPAATAVKDGILAAATTTPETGQAALPVVIYATGDQEDEVVAGYEQAVSQQARAIIGPIGRTPVSGLALRASGDIPVIALTQTENSRVSLGNWYTLALSAEQEARSVARLAAASGARRALVILTDPVFGARLQNSFADEWQKLGGSISNTLALQPSQAELKALRASFKAGGEQPEVIFLATDAKAARQIRPYLDLNIPTWATSHAFDAYRQKGGNLDLLHLQFVDTPWLVQLDHLAVMTFPRPQRTLRADLARLYALGIDAWRIAQQLTSRGLTSGFELDGVTGKLTLDESGVFRREPVAAEIGETAAIPKP